MPADFQLMGVVNVTPDSFSDGGLFLDPDAAVAHGRRLVEEGADILDVGGESTRPRGRAYGEGAAPVGLDEELRRVMPVLEGLAPAGTRLSIDTSKAAVATRAIEAGATLVNDVTALRGDPAMAGVVAERGVDCCLMHMLGDPRTMQAQPGYEDVVSEVKAFLEARIAAAVREGIAEDRILVDPGIGFGKTVEHNLELLRRLEEIAALGRPVVIGTSRKSFLGAVTGRELPDRLPATIASNLLAWERGAHVLRVHEVAPVRDALTLAAATVTPRWRVSLSNPTTTSSTT